MKEIAGKSPRGTSLLSWLMMIWEHAGTSHLEDSISLRRDLVRVAALALMALEALDEKQEVGGIAVVRADGLRNLKGSSGAQLKLVRPDER